MLVMKAATKGGREGAKWRGRLQCKDCGIGMQKSVARGRGGEAGSRERERLYFEVDEEEDAVFCKGGHLE